MMDRHGELLLCKPCRHQAEVDAARPKPPSRIRKWGVPIAVLLVLVVAGIRIAPMILSKPADVKVEGPHDWTKDPPSKWPALAVHIMPSEGSAVPAGWQLGPNACLVERHDGTILCVTGVTDPTTLQDALQARNMAKPKAAPLSAAPPFEEFTRSLSASHLSAGSGRTTFTKLLPDNHRAFEHDILCFTEPSGILPKEWIVLRTHETESSPGTKVIVVARDAKTGAQVPLEAVISPDSASREAASSPDKAHPNGDATQILVKLSRPYAAVELTGAPVVDPRGHLVAIITRRSSPTDPNGLSAGYFAYDAHALDPLAAKAPPTK
jgi:hypothetical protein